MKRKNRFEGKIIRVSNRLEVICDAHKTKKINSHATYRMEDYLEVVYELVQHKGYVTS